jgi:hypothetical protein
MKQEFFSDGIPDVPRIRNLSEFRSELFRGRVMLGFSELWNKNRRCAADFSLLNLPKGKSLGRSKPALIPKHKHCNTLCGRLLLYPSLTELPSIEIK